MKIEVYVAIADNHDYDAMSQWLVGVFTTEEAAQAAIKKDKKIKRKEHIEAFGKETKVYFTYNETIEKTFLELAG